MIARVNNVPTDCKQFVVARIENNELWYWGSWDDEAVADDNAKIIDGIVLINCKE